MENIQIYKNNEFEVRTVEVNGTPYFVGKDVTEILGYKNGSRDINRHVDEDDRGCTEMVSPQGTAQTTTIINESGLYSLILSSKMAKAKQFKRWVTSEVLPSIRKHGMYAMDELIANPDLAITALTALKKEREEKQRLAETVMVQNQQILELKPKATYYDLVLNCKDLLATTAIAKDYGLSAKKLNQILHDKKIQFKQGDLWLLYQKYADKGYTSTKTNSFPDNKGEIRAKLHTYWTQKGRLFIYEILKGDGIVPLIEREFSDD